MEMSERLENIFKHLHSHPELSWQEFETTNYIKSLFENENCQITTFDGFPGLTIDIGSGKPVIALRADIDALWQEVNGEFQANHSCGHDAHMTIVIGTIFSLLQDGPPQNGTYRFIFQPAEEKGTGALEMVKRGVIDDVDYLFGMHLRPIQELSYGYFSPAIQHGAAKFIQGKITGDDAHGARPHLNANAIQVGTELFQHINNIHLNPSIPYSVKMTQFNAGGKSSNIIPGNATFSLDLRAQTNEAMEHLTNRVEKIASMLSDYHEVSIDLEIGANIAAAVLSQEATSIIEQAITDSVGEKFLKPTIQTTGGDDFHFYTIKRPHVKATMLAIGCDLKPGLHHPDMTFNHQIIPQSVEILKDAMNKALSLK